VLVNSKKLYGCPFNDFRGEYLFAGKFTLYDFLFEFIAICVLVTIIQFTIQHIELPIIMLLREQSFDRGRFMCDIDLNNINIDCQ